MDKKFMVMKISEFYRKLEGENMVSKPYLFCFRLMCGLSTDGTKLSDRVYTCRSYRGEGGCNNYDYTTETIELLKKLGLVRDLHYIICRSVSKFWGRGEYLKLTRKGRRKMIIT